MNPPSEHDLGTLPELQDALFAYVFGSFGSERFSPESDIDLAADFGRKLSANDRLNLVTGISDRLHRDVDLIDLRSADPIIAMQVLRTGRPVLVRDRKALTIFQMKTPSRYFDWKICRRPFEQAMWASGAR